MQGKLENISKGNMMQMELQKRKRKSFTRNIDRLHRTRSCPSKQHQIHSTPTNRQFTRYIPQDDLPQQHTNLSESERTKQRGILKTATGSSYLRQQRYIRVLLLNRVHSTNTMTQRTRRDHSAGTRPAPAACTRQSPAATEERFKRFEEERR